MATAKNAKKGMSKGAMVALGAASLALAAGAYYFFGPDGKKNRGKLKGWMIKMKGDIVEKMEQAKELSEEAYHAIVDKVAMAAAKAGKGTPEEVAAFAAMLKRQWKGFSRTPAKKKPAKAPATSASKKKVASKKSK